MRIALLTLVLFCLARLSFSQQPRFSFYARANHSMIQDISYLPPTPPTSSNTGFSVLLYNVGFRQTFKESFGFDLGGEASFNLNSKVSLRTGIGINQFRFQQRLESISSDGTNQVSLTGFTRDPILPGVILVGSAADNTPTGTVRGLQFPTVDLIEPPQKLGKTSTLYLTFPVTIDYSPFSKWIFSAGFSASLLARAAHYKEEAQFYSYPGFLGSGYYRTELVKDTSGDGFANMLLNGIIQVNYFVTKKISIDLGGQYSFTPIYDERPVSQGTSRMANYTSLSLGARYWLKQ